MIFPKGLCPKAEEEWSLYHNASLSLIFGIEFCESLKDVCRKIVVVYRDFSL
jgi:hypothetical protein